MPVATQREPWAADSARTSARLSTSPLRHLCARCEKKSPRLQLLLHGVVTAGKGHSTTSTRPRPQGGGGAIDSRERWPNVITTVPECQYQSIYLHVKHATPCRATSCSGGFRPSTSRFVYCSCSITTSRPLCWIPHLTQYENPGQCRMRQLLSARTTTPPNFQAP